MLDKYDEQIRRIKLRKSGLPVILNKQELFNILEIMGKESAYFYSNNRKKLYRQFSIKKRSGARRIIEAPRKDLKEIQRAIKYAILDTLPVSKNVTSYIKGKSIIDNALPHIGAKTLIKFDIKDFFPSISMKEVYWLFRHNNYSREVSHYLSLLCVNTDYKLPQGAPTSPTLSNVIAKSIDYQIDLLCKRNGNPFLLSYTRYADDITISSKMRLDTNVIFQIKFSVYNILKRSGFEPNNDKFKFYREGQKLLVTGLNVRENKNLYPDNKKTREIEIAIHCINKFGIWEHLQHINKKRDNNWSQDNYINHLFGLIHYITMIDKAKGMKYLAGLKKALGYE